VGSERPDRKYQEKENVRDCKEKKYYREHRDWRVMAGTAMGKSTKRNIARIHPQSNENLSNDSRRDRVPLS